MIKKTIAIAYSLFALLAFVVGYLSNSGPLDYIFVIIAGVPWIQLLSWVFASGDGSPAIPVIGVLINLILIWWWALRPVQRSM